MKQTNNKKRAVPLGLFVCFLLLWKLPEVKNQPCSPLACVDHKKGTIFVEKKKMNISVNCVEGGESDGFRFIIRYRVLSTTCLETRLIEKHSEEKKKKRQICFIFPNIFLLNSLSKNTDT